MRKQGLGLVGLWFIQRGAPGFHGRIVAEVDGPTVKAEVCSWKDHAAATVRVFSLDDLRAFDLYPTRKAWLAAVDDVAQNGKSSSA